MNLNQAAHGDREFGLVQTRLGVARKTVAGHVERPAWSPAASASGRGPRSAAPSCRRCGWPASATTCATSRSPRATRSRPSCASASRSTPTASTTWSTVVDAVADERRSTRWSPSTPTPTTCGPSCCPAATGTSRCATAPASRLGLRAFLTDGGFTAFTTNFEDLGGLRQLPGLAVQRLMADGYGFGGEGDWKTVGHAAHAQGGGRRAARRHVLHGGLHLPPGARRGEDPRRAHARGLPVHRGRPGRRCEIHPLGIGGREDPVRLVFDAAPGDGRRPRHWPTWATGSGSSPTRSRSWPAGRAAAEAAGRPRGLAAGARPRAPRPSPG